MADEKVNVSSEEKKAPEAPAPSGPGDPPAPEHTEGPAVPGGDQTAPVHAEPAAGEHTQQTVLPDMGEDAPAPSGKVINLSDIQAADKGGKEASAPAPDKKAPETDKPPKRRGRPPKEQAGPTVEKKSKAAEPRTGRPSKVDKAAREEAPPAVRDKVVCTPSSRQRNNLHFTHENPSCIPYGAGCYAASRRSWTSIGVRTPRPRWRRWKL
jgi:ParB family chromosome partitioning protein